MKADQLNEFDKKDWEENESVNLHSENALELAKEFGTPEEVEAMQRIMDQHMRRGHILPHEIEERNALTSKYYSMLEHSVNPNTSDYQRIVISFNISLEKKYFKSRFNYW